MAIKTIKPGPGKPPKKGMKPTVSKAYASDTTSKPTVKMVKKTTVKSVAKPVTKSTSKSAVKPMDNIKGTTLKAVQARAKESYNDKDENILNRMNAVDKTASSEIEYIRNLKGSKRMSMNQEDSAFNAIRRKGNIEMSKLEDARDKLSEQEKAKRAANPTYTGYGPKIKPIRKTGKKKK